jgi:hypothetical protein
MTDGKSSKVSDCCVDLYLWLESHTDKQVCPWHQGSTNEFVPGTEHLSNS